MSAPSSESRQRTRGPFRFQSKIERRIARKVGRAVHDYRMVEEGDEILLAVSGGKDSLTMARILVLLARRAPVRFRMTAVTFDQGFGGLDPEEVGRQMADLELPLRVEQLPMAEILREKLAPGSSPCGLCSRIRRGAMYTLARSMGCNKIALGHHLDDLIETLLMNLFYSGQLRSMAPRLRSDDGRNLVIRPLCYVTEAWIREYVAGLSLATVSCSTEICGMEDSSRQQTKALVESLAGRIHGLRGNVLRALQTVRWEHLLDRGLADLCGGAKPGNLAITGNREFPVR